MALCGSPAATTAHRDSQHRIPRPIHRRATIQAADHWQTDPAQRGAIAAGNPDANPAGIAVLEEGGNAFDAAVATAFAMGVVEPLDSGLGGGGFATLHDAVRGEIRCFDCMGAAPLGAAYSLYQVDAPDTGYRIQVRGGANEYGHQAVAVPGAVAGIAAISGRFGTLPLARCLAPAIRLAEERFAMAPKPVVRFTRFGIGYCPYHSYPRTRVEQ